MTDKENNNKYEPLKAKMWVYVLLSVAIIVVCSIMFIYNVRRAYDGYTGGGFYGPAHGVFFMHGIVAFFAVVASVVLKSIFQKKVSFIILLILSMVLPVICYSFNYNGFKNDGPLRSLVSEDGILRFLAIHDFDFNGVDDAHEKVRQVSGIQGCYGERVSGLKYVVEGKGQYTALGGCYFIEKENVISVSMADSETSATYNYIRFTLTLKNPEDAEKLSIYYLDTKLESKIENGNQVTVTLDSQFCADRQKEFDKSIYIDLKCVWEENSETESE